MNNKEDITAIASIRILKLREQLYAGLHELFKSFSITEPQYNVLRILNGVRPDGLPSLEIGRRMITRIPDITRLLDRLEKQNLIKRSRNELDRRIVTAQITSKGIKLIKNIETPLNQFHHDFWADFKKQELVDLIKLTNKI